MQTIFIIFISWLIPGSGYWYLGQKTKAFLLFILITSCFVVGMAMTNFQNVAFTKETFWGQIFVGLPAFIAANFTPPTPNTPVLNPQIFDTGLLYTYTSSLLNILVILQSYIVHISRYDKQ